MRNRIMPHKLKYAIDYGPLFVFFVAYKMQGLMTATAALMIAATAAVLGSYFYTRKLAPMPLFTFGIICVLGGLTLWLKDETFIKMKPTIVEACFAAILLGGAALGRLPIRAALGGAFDMDDAGWRALNLRAGLFCALLAILNEVVWRTQPTETWVIFKVAGLSGLMVLFILLQIPLLRRHLNEK